MIGGGLELSKPIDALDEKRIWGSNHQESYSIHLALIDVRAPQLAASWIVPCSLFTCLASETLFIIHKCNARNIEDSMSGECGYMGRLNQDTVN